MTRVLYLHVGGPKSGTTYLQRVLEHNADTLARAGVLVAGPRLELIHAAMAVREDKRLADLPSSAGRAWGRVVAQVREWEGHAAVVSYELFAGASAEQAARALSDLDDLEVHVVVTARDLATAIPSSWQEQLKFGVTKSLEDWTPPPESAASSEWGWRTMQPANVAARWGAGLPTDRVHVVTVPRERGDRTELWRRFAEATGLRDVPGLDLEVERVNESLGVVEAELLRRVNLGLRSRVRGGRAKSIWIRDLLAHHLLAPVGREPIGLTPEQLQESADQADRAISAIDGAGYAVHGDLEDLRPRPVPARTPAQVTDAEVAESAALVLGDLLVWAREAGADPRSRAGGGEDGTAGSDRGEQPDDSGAPGAPGSSVLARARRALGAQVARAAAPYRDRRVAGLQQRIARLEAEVERSRALHLRVATLQDLVSELLLPADHRDDDVTQDALRDYRERSL